MVLSAVKQALERMNITDERITVGLSGGADSVCLLLCLKELGMNLQAVHVHHMIRQDEADRDAAFAADLCKSNGIDFFLEKINVPEYAREQGLTLEQAARNARYEALSKHAQGGLIAVAHNLNDQAETVLLRLVRGTGTDGLTAIKERNGNIIRPLLNVSRQQIEQFCALRLWQYVTDSTNLIADCSRNIIRLNVLNELEKINPSAVQGIARAASLMAQDAQYLALQAQQSDCITAYSDTVKVEIKKLLQLHPALQGRVLRLAISKVDTLVDIEQTHVTACLKLCMGQSGKRLDLPRGITVLCDGQYLVIGHFTLEKNHSQAAFGLGEFVLGKTLISVQSVNKMGRHEKNVEYFSPGDISDIVLRHRRESDYIYPLGASGKKSVKKYLIDKKVPLHLRDGLVLAARGSHVLAIVGLTVDRSAAVTDGKIYKIELK